MQIFASDSVSSALGAALDGLSERQRISAHNIANIDTPGFTATTVDFESSLRSALADGAIAAGEAAPVNGTSNAPRRPDGNNVDLGAETVTAMQSVFQYQLMTRAVSDRFSQITTSIGGY